MQTITWIKSYKTFVLFFFWCFVELDCTIPEHELYRWQCHVTKWKSQKHLLRGHELHIHGLSHLCETSKDVTMTEIPKPPEIQSHWNEYLRGCRTEREGGERMKTLWGSLWSKVSTLFQYTKLLILTTPIRSGRNQPDGLSAYSHHVKFIVEFVRGKHGQN